MRSYYQVDGLGSTRVLTNASGVVTDRYIYDAFGRMIGQSGSTLNVYLFAGEQRDANVGLDYLRARYLSVWTGRFYGRDSIQGVKTAPMTEVPYLYAVANPVNGTDPTGRFPLSVAILTAQILDIIGSYRPSNPAPPGSITCGPEITRPLTAVISKLYRTWNNWTPDERQKAIDGLTSRQTGPKSISSASIWLNAWDIVELRKIALDPGGKSSVRVGSECYYAGSVNYVLYGHMARLSGFSEPEMLTYIGLYSTVWQWKQGNPTKPNYEASRDWAIAGYEGWPFVRVQIPKGDRPYYLTGNSEPYSGPEFHFNWFPNGTY
jgi:RHS repeat-associated protein